MDDEPRFRTLEELPEYTAQLDEIIAKYPVEVIEPVLRVLMWGILTNPMQYDRIQWNHRIAKSQPFKQEEPTIRIFFKIKNEGTAEETLLLCWIEEISSLDE
jgi:hypothetical protein